MPAISKLSTGVPVAIYSNNLEGKQYLDAGSEGNLIFTNKEAFACFFNTSCLLGKKP